MDLVFTGGQIFAQAGQKLSAIAIKNGKIAAVNEQAEAAATGAKTHVELNGDTLLPSVGDGHAHPLFGGLERQGPQVREETTIEGIVARVKEYADAHPELDWIVGASYEPSLTPDGGFDARWLDEAVPDRPVLLRAIDYHTVWCNTKALQLSGVTKDTPDPPLGWIDRRDDGEPLGTLREWHACDFAFRAAPKNKPEELRTALLDAMASMNRSGTTWMQDAWVEVDGHKPYLDVVGSGEATVRTALSFRADPDMWRDQLPEFLRMRREIAELDQDQMLSAHTIKFFADGVIESATASVLEPYVHDCHHGMKVWQPEALKEAVRLVDALGFQVHIHAIGDAGIRASLDAIEYTIGRNTSWDRRATITHVQLVHPDDLPRFAQLGVIPNYQPLWAQRDGLMDVLTAPKLGPERTDLQYPIATILRGTGLGVGPTKMSMSSDWPCSTLTPWESMSVAMTRLNDAGLPEGGWLPHERLTFEEAFTGYSIGNAYQGYLEKVWGQLHVGFSADMVRLAGDVTQDPAQALKSPTVVATWLAGKQVFG